MLSAAAQSVWAKTDPDHDSWMSLPRHLDDTAAIAGLLWDEWLPASTRNRIAAAVRGNDADGRALLSWLAGVHDAGKASPAFAVQVERTTFSGLTASMRREGLDMPGVLADRPLLRHELVGHHALCRWLIDGHGWSRGTSSTYAVVVGGHHGAPPQRADLKRARERSDLLGEGRWAEVREELFDRAAQTTGASVRLERWGAAPLPVPVQAVLSGLVIVADWLASNGDLFPHGDARSSEQRAAEAWRQVGFSPPWRATEPPPQVEDLYARRFTLPAGSRPRPVQRAVLDVVHRDAVPGIVIVEAPMGEGKTEAALAAAEVLAHRTGAGGLFVALPTTATSDAMFARVRRWAERLPSTGSGAEISLELAHGRAALNDEARWLPRARAATAVAADAGEHGSPSTLGVVADQWLHGRKKTALLASVVVGTVDQVLLSALKSRHLVLRHLGLAGKVVIVDEVHAMDTYMGSYLQRALRWLGAHGSPVVLLSATLASGQRRSLVAAYAEGVSGAATDTDILSRTVGYPAITSWSRGGVTVDVVPDDGARRQHVEVHRLDDGDEALVDLLTSALADGGCAAVVRNTVGRAQVTYELLRDRLAASMGCEVVLLHSRFVAADRAERERDLAERLGPVASRTAAGPERPDRIVVVGTQVIEQSLDVDLDLMVTDLAPVDLVLQRMGRLHRHQRGVGQGERPAAVRTPRCYLTGVEDWALDPPRAVKGSRLVYREAPLLRSSAVLAVPLDRGSITLPDDIAPLVERAYAEDLDVPAGWEHAFAAAEKDRREHHVVQEDRAGRFQLAPPAALGSSLVGWLSDSAGEADDSAPSAGQVRDTQDDVEVVLVQRVEGQVRLLPRSSGHGSEVVGGEVIETEWRPDDRLARIAAACTVRLPMQLSNPRVAGRTVAALERTHYPGWQQSPWLSGLLVLELDEHLSATLTDQRITYDRERGLRVARED